jgi:predicted nucleic acid-binding protein
MRTVFSDAAFYIALSSSRDQNHLIARRFAGSFTGRVVTTEYILTEVANFLSHPAHREKTVELLDELRADPKTEIVSSSHELWDRGLDLYARRPDKGWSLTDCISFAVMTERGLTDTLTVDRDFEQAGFKVLLKNDTQ